MALRVIISGGIGTGKSTAADVFAALGAQVVSADRIGHEVLEQGGAAHAEVVARWPQVVHEGTIDRRALGRIVFDDPDELRLLESITHPAIRSRILETVATSEAPAVFVELPIAKNLLGEGWVRVVIDAPIDVRRERLRRRGMDDREIDQRMEVQPSRDEWLAWADHVVDNAGGLDDLGRECLRVWHLLTADVEHLK